MRLQKQHTIASHTYGCHAIHRHVADCDVDVFAVNVVCDLLHSVAENVPQNRDIHCGIVLRTRPYYRPNRVDPRHREQNRHRKLG